MSKHPLDHGHDGSTARMERFTELERSDKPSEAAKKLQQRAKNEPDSRLEKFTRIERGIKE
ncbi:MAG: hypothetical protein KDK01_10380 [Rhodobacteraceae bacterium]|jgi:hypothetical protein|nr:hypothetical protein [Paracoccaceae bacterium]